MKAPTRGTREQEATTTDVQFTCPMHPEVVKPQQGRCPKCNMKLEPKGRPKSRPA